MKLFKRISAIIISAAMVVTMAAAVMASEPGSGNVPSAADTATATVLNVEAGNDITATAYQIVKGSYIEKGFLEYVPADGVAEGAIANVVAPTAEEVLALAADTEGLVKKEMVRQEDGSFTANLNAGYWIVLIRGTVSDVYNPLLVGVYYSVSGSEDTMVSAPVDANGKWTLQASTAYAKSSTVPMVKTVVNTSSGNSHGDDHMVGDEIVFSIETQIPSYTNQYSSATFRIHDTLSAGLDYVGANPVVSVTKAGAVVPADKYTVYVDGKDMVVLFKSAYVMSEESTGPVTVQYKAVLNEKAKVGFSGEKNTAYVEYTNEPGTEGGETPVDPDDPTITPPGTTVTPGDTTHHYTFDIDGNVGGTKVVNKEGKIITLPQTHDLIKVNSNEIISAVINGEVSYKNTKDSKATEFVLEGAEFTLYAGEKAAADAKIETSITDKNGHMMFTGLDAGVYTLKETKAPAGYSLNDTLIPVVIEASYNADGTLKSYSIKINGQNTATYTANYYEESTESGDAVEVVEVKYDDALMNPFEVTNTKLNKLPSTGGAGTLAFTAAGVIIMLAAVFLLFKNNKSKKKDD